MSEKITRKEFLKRLTFLGVTAAGAGAVLQACGGGDKQDTGAAKTDSANNFSCNDLTGLSEQDIQTRRNMKYVDRSPNPDKICSGCQFWVKPAGGQNCGACTVVKGPIHPDGYCITWMPRMG